MKNAPDYVMPRPKAEQLTIVRKALMDRAKERLAMAKTLSCRVNEVSPVKLNNTALACLLGIPKPDGNEALVRSCTWFIRDKLLGPLCSDSHGYWYGTQSEFQESRKSLERRIKTQQKTVGRLTAYEEKRGWV